MLKFKTLYLVSFVLMSSLIPLSIFGQHHQHVQVKVEYSSAEDEQIFRELGISTCDISSIDQEHVTFTMGANQLKVLEESSLKYEVLIENLGQYYGDLYRKNKASNRTAKKTNKVANAFGTGSLGNYYTYDEVVAKLDEMTSQYGNIASQKINIGTTIEGNIIWAIKISDNPNTDENEPVAYYDALHHSNEYNSMATVVNYMFWLLENYNTDPRVKYIINNRELYFVPVVNVDGYKSNEAYFVQNGVVGGQRKNNRQLNGVKVGVDLNRNYAQGYNIAQYCSNPDNPSAGNYPGTSAFSEPESRAIRDFTAQINPKIALSCHAGAGAYLMPYGYSNNVNDVPDFKTYSTWGTDFLSNVDSYFGTTFTQLGYISCGTTRSYLHSTGTFAWTPELGPFFSSSPQEIYDNADMHIEPFLYNAYIAGGFADVKSHEITSDVLPGQSFDLNVTIQNKGVGESAGPVSLELVSTNSYFSRPAFVSYGSIAAGSESTRSMTANLGQGFTGDQFDLTMVVYQNGEEMTRETITVNVGQKNELFADDAESGSNNWTSSGGGTQWGTTTVDSYSGSVSFCDSPGRFDKYFYETNTTTNFISPTINLTSTQNPVVSFASKWSMRPGTVLNVQVSSNGGSSWSTIDTYTDNQKWKHQTYQIATQFRTPNFKVRFRLNNQTSGRADGFYLDDFEVSDYAAAPQVCNVPSNPRTLSSSPTKVKVKWDSPPGAEHVVFLKRIGFSWVYYEGAYPDKEYEFDNLVPGSSYDYAIRSICNNAASEYMIARFDTPINCDVPQNLGVSNITVNAATVVWDAVSAADHYMIQIRQTGTTNWSTVSSTQVANSINIDGLSPATDYEWRVRSNCPAGNTSGFGVSNFRTNNPSGGGTCNLYNLTTFETGDMGIWNDGGSYATIYRNSSFAPTGEWAFYIARSGEQATLISDVISVNAQNVKIDFNYKSLNGGAGNKFYLERKVNNGTWAIVKTFEYLTDYNRGQVTNWQTSINGASINNLELRFRADMVTTDYLFLDDIKIELCGDSSCVDQDQDGVCADTDPNDNDPCVPNNCGGLTCENTVTSTCQYLEDFTSGLGLWNQSSDDDLNWINRSGSTPSVNTGPSDGLNGGNYLYIEASGSTTGYPNKSAIIASPCIDLTGYESGVLFYTHMYGSNMGNLYFEVTTDGNQWETLMTFEGNQGNEWVYQQYVIPAALRGQSVQFRFRGVTGTSWSSDIAIDRFKIFCNDDFVENSNRSKKLSIDDLSEINVFPNPASQKINIVGQLEGQGPVNLQIVNMQGVVVFLDEVSTKSSQLELEYDISNFNPGLYYIQFIRGKEVTTKSLVVVPNE